MIFQRLEESIPMIGADKTEPLTAQQTTQASLHASSGLNGFNALTSVSL
ncbi:hypothetical protein SCARR_01549 [Pontiella sulfatireligans]|uniref:Uncharacterized protein n=1 Tax=Pontiella sulfatireligans TaxID=2750658 RepID=A0A6C2UH27_9BACT|nr:hypothetical protein SCARR_01549 [Pontiella sulfatireligans]